MNKLAFALAVIAASVAFAEEANIEPVPKGKEGYSKIFYVKDKVRHVLTAKDMTPPFKQLELEHGKRVGITKNPITCIVEYHFEDGYVYSIKLPKALINDPTKCAHINRTKIAKLMKENAERKLKASKKGGTK